MCFAKDMDVGDRTALAVTLLLTVVAVGFSMQEGLPNVAYSTYLDKYKAFAEILLSLTAVLACSSQYVPYPDLYDRFCSVGISGLWLAVHMVVLAFRGGRRGIWFRKPWSDILADRSDRMSLLNLKSSDNKCVFSFEDSEESEEHEESMAKWGHRDSTMDFGHKGTDSSSLNL